MHLLFPALSRLLLCWCTLERYVPCTALHVVGAGLHRALVERPRSARICDSAPSTPSARRRARRAIGPPTPKGEALERRASLGGLCRLRLAGRPLQSDRCIGDLAKASPPPVGGACGKGLPSDGLGRAFSSLVGQPRGRTVATVGFPESGARVWWPGWASA